MLGIRVLSYNIHKGFDAVGRQFVLKTMKTAIREAGADFVFLQEVHGENTEHQANVPDWPTASQFEFLADSVWSHYAYGKNAIYDAGHHGNAILSRFPIVAWENLDISTNRWEQRGLLHAVVQVPPEEGGQRIHLLCVHLNLLEGGRKTQLARIGKRVSEAIPPHEPLIVAGDFNDWRERASGILKKTANLDEAFLETRGSHARSFPSRFPFLRLDRIYFRGLRATGAIELSGAPWRELSDHLAISATLVL